MLPDFNLKLNSSLSGVVQALALSQTDSEQRIHQSKHTRGMRLEIILTKMPNIFCIEEISIGTTLVCANIF